MPPAQLWAKRGAGNSAGGGRCAPGRASADRCLPKRSGARAMKNFDVVIAGAGMAGASLAAEISRNASVLLLEMESQPGYHATGRSVAFWAERPEEHTCELQSLIRHSYAVLCL